MGFVTEEGIACCYSTIAVRSLTKLVQVKRARITFEGEIMTGLKPTPKTAEPTIALTVTDHSAQQGFQQYVAGVAEAFREKQRARREDTLASEKPLAKPSNG